MKNIIRIAISICMILLLNTFAIAIPAKNIISYTDTKITEDMNIKENKVIIFTFENQPLIASKKSIDTLNNNMLEMYMTYDTEVDTITIGYTGGSKIGYDEIYQMVNNELLKLNEEYISDKRLNKGIMLETFNINKVNIERIEISLSNDEYKNMDLEKFKESINANNAYEISLENNKSISSSTNNINVITNNRYHSIVQIWDAVTQRYYPETRWYKNGILSNICKSWRNEVNSLEPHMGDGNGRYGEGNSWMPNLVDVGFNKDWSAGKNRVKLFYYYNSDGVNLSKLQNDSDEGLELDIVFYNFGVQPDPNNSGTSFVKQYKMSLSNTLWVSNQPTAYLDTDFGYGVENNAVTYCIGVENANQLQTGVWYYWYITGEKGEERSQPYPNDGRFKVNAQRTYQYNDVFTLIGSIYDGAYGQATWRRFTEEHEGTISLGLSSVYYWLPGYNNSPGVNYSAWYLANTNTEWSYNSSIHTIKHTNYN